MTSWNEIFVDCEVKYKQMMKSDSLTSEERGYASALYDILHKVDLNKKVGGIQSLRVTNIKPKILK